MIQLLKKIKIFVSSPEFLLESISVILVAFFARFFGVRATIALTIIVIFYNFKYFYLRNKAYKELYKNGL